MKKASFEEVVTKAKAIHGEKYSYLNLDRSTPKPQLTVSCKVHGQFTQQLSNHLSGKGCPKCALALTNRSSVHTLESVASLGARLHKGKYTYLKLERTPSAPKLTLSCDKHGEFQQDMYAHLSGKGCIKCAFKYTVLEILDAAHKRHSSKYDYVGYLEESETLKVFCKEHGMFLQGRQAHLAGSGCLVCARKIIGQKASISLETAQARAPTGVVVEKIGRNEFNRGRLNFVTAFCGKHGQFLKGSDTIKNGCPKCSYEKKSIEASSTLVEFVEKAEEQHGRLYGYLALDRQNIAYPKVVALCPTHGVFSQGMAQHLQGARCPKCAVAKSKLATEFVKWIQEIEPETALEVVMGEGQSRWDAVVESKKLAFEFHGLYWHSEQHKPRGYHYSKHKQGLTAGFRTVHIFEDEWLERKEAVKALIANSLGKTTAKVFARKCLVIPVEGVEANRFLEMYHIQGKPSGSKHLGLMHEEKLVGVMSYALRESGRGKVSSTEHLEITRYATNIQVLGGFSKLLKHLERNNRGLRNIYTFSDIRCFTGDMYAKCGFNQVAELKPDYFYVKAGKRQHKATLQKSNFRKNPKLLFDAALTETQLAVLNNFYRVYDCGKIKWEKPIS